MKRFLLIHKLQQIQAKILSKVPIGGMFTFVSEDCKVVLKEEQARGFSGAVQGHRSQTALAGSQWKSMCSKVSSAPHHAHRMKESHAPVVLGRMEKINSVSCGESFVTKLCSIPLFL